MLGAAPYRDRLDAGRVLAARIAEELRRAGIVGRQALVLGLPRGGVVVAAPVAEHLGADLDVLCVRKLGVPGHEELAFGAIATGGAQVVDEHLVRRLGLRPAAVQAVVDREGRELERREHAYRGDRPPPWLPGRTAIVVDDGLATGATARAACAALREAGTGRIVVAVPVAPPEAVESLETLADLVVCPMTPRRFSAVGRWYDDFAEVSDEQVRALLGARAADST